MAEQVTDGVGDIVHQLGPATELPQEGLARIAKLTGVRWDELPVMRPLAGPYYEDLLDQIKGAEQCLICFTDQKDWNVACPPWILGDEEIRNVPVGMVVFDVSFRFNNVHYGRIALGYDIGGIAAFILATNVDRLPNVHFHNFPDTIESIRHYHDSPPDNVDFEITVLIVTCSEVELVALLLSPEVPLATKVLSTYLTMFPKTGHLFHHSVTQISFHSFSASYEIDIEAVRDLRCSERYHALTAIYSLGPAFSRHDKLRDQLYDGYRTAKKTANIREMTKASFMAIYDKCENLVQFLTPAVLDYIGRILALNTNKNVDLHVTTPNLLPHDQAADLWGCNKWSKALYKQIRLVYQRHGLTTIDLADRASTLIAASILEIEPELQEERDALYAAVALAKDKPYIGMQRKHIDVLNFTNFPFWAVVGAEYHGISLEEKEAEEWKTFNTDWLIEHFAFVYQRGIASMMARSIPSPLMINAILFAKENDTARLEKALSSLPANSVDIIYWTLAKDSDPGLWYQRKYEEKAAKLRSEMRAIALEGHDVRMKCFMDFVDAEIEATDNPARKKTLKDYKAGKIAQANAAIKKFDDATFKMPSPRQ
ncbi:uncharacterized protein LOC131881845 [Tigriopus californicus]|uniref:uncharacterized protein LOC131881845 n=1 Tax=Tigriopus californicus TaxID=6832 RepID=UPI0027DA2303|nr:uncharacterized protein LOC131881845 [Tigriopus californicus]|eukprot:TCALIF_09434-PA protein Name:"Protein of unknown function" AED:0.00 eAED:0.00 QI:109/1/1/1/1/1/2/232/596